MTELLERVTPGTRRIAYAFAAAVGILLIGAIALWFASWTSLRAMLILASFIGFVAAGQTFVILVGGIDLSVPWVLNAAGILFAVASLGHNGRAIPAVVLALGLGLALGAVNGFCVAYLAVPAVVMTLAMNGVMEGLTLGLHQGLTAVSFARRTRRGSAQDAVPRGACSVPADHRSSWLEASPRSPASSSPSRPTGARSTRRETTRPLHSSPG